jgi:hypothetical protein
LALKNATLLCAGFPIPHAHRPQVSAQTLTPPPKANQGTGNHHEHATGRLWDG